MTIGVAHPSAMSISASRGASSTRSPTTRPDRSTPLTHSANRRVIRTHMRTPCGTAAQWNSCISFLQFLSSFVAGWRRFRDLNVSEAKQLSNECAVCKVADTRSSSASDRSFDSRSPVSQADRVHGSSERFALVRSAAASGHLAAEVPRVIAAAACRRSARPSDTHTAAASDRRRRRSSGEKPQSTPVGCRTRPTDRAPPPCRRRRCPGPPWQWPMPGTMNSASELAAALSDRIVDPLVHDQAGVRRHQRIGPSVIHQQLAAAAEEARQVRVAAVQQPVVRLHRALDIVGDVESCGSPSRR